MKRSQHIFNFRVERSELSVERSSSASSSSHFSVQRSTFSVRRFLPSPLFPFPYRTSSRRGATLIVTLGVLTVLSVMVVTFLLSARYHSLSAKHFSDKTVAQQALSFALAEAMQSIDDAMVASNYVANSNSLSDTEKSKRRVYPLKLWRAVNDTGTFNKRPNQNSDTFLLPVPDSTSASTNNLLNAEVGRFLPATLTNWISPNDVSQTLCGGWTNFTAETRVSYAVFNCSGFIDAHCYATTNALVVTTQRVVRTYFSQQDFLRDTPKDPVLNIAASNPFFITSYDTDPHAMPLARTGVQLADSFGTRSFAPPPKFDINSITNYFLSLDGLGVKKRLAVMPRSWFNNVTSLLQSASIANLDRSDDDGRDAYFGDPKKAAWNIVNYMTESRIPTAFPDNAFESNTASRLDYAIEAVPLINEVQLQDIFGDTKTENSYAGAHSRYQAQLWNIDQYLRSLFTAPAGTTAPTVNIEWSNIYAFNVELWYPFKPRPVPENTYLWLSATTNSPSLFASTQSPYAWLDDDYSSLGHELFSEWSSLFAQTSTNANTVATNDIAWTAISTNAVLLYYITYPDDFDTASNQTEIAEGISEIWSITYLSGIQSFTNSSSYTSIFLDLTQAYTNRLTQSVVANNMSGVTAVLETPYSDLVDWGDATAWAQYFQALFKTTASQFSEYEKFDVSTEYGTPGNEGYANEYHVFYGTNLVYQPYIETNKNTGTGPDTITVRFKPLAGEKSAESGYSFYTWLRSMVTVREINLDGSLGEDVGIPETADEALLIRNGSKDTDIGFYKRWDKPGSISIDDPRDNAYVDRWPMQNEISASMGSENENCNVAEYPFIHYDRPFQSIGELGYINVDLTNRFDDIHLPHLTGKSARDTIDFSTRSGASLLDKFCIGGVSNVTRGLVQANTTHSEVIRRVLNRIAIGWPTDTGGKTSGDRFGMDSAQTQPWINHWTNTLLRAYADSSTPVFENSGLAGWTCFADMLPDLSTNALTQKELPQLPAKVNEVGPKTSVYDYLEDVMRGIIDKVSFRQNIYVVVIAAQTLSPASTDEHPIVLADQRAAVTVIRDAFTGRWMIANWTWLTE
jgi:hypothetical protein